MKTIIKCLVLLIVACQFISCVDTEQEKPNILFIAVDDLRPELGFYYNDIIKTPNMDELSLQSVVFPNAYCQVPVCGASRASLLTSLYAGKGNFTDAGTRVDTDAWDRVTLPQHFKNNGYHTLSIGKIFHHYNDALQSWSELPYRPPDVPVPLSGKEDWLDYQSDENIDYRDLTRKPGAPLFAVSGMAWESAEVADSVYFDGQITNHAIDKIQELGKLNKPFFLALGFLKPHLPFNAPKKYWDLYHQQDLEKILTRNASNFPQELPKEAWFNSLELRSYSNIPDTGNIDKVTALNLVHGYYACVSYVDHLIGEVIQSLKQNDLYDNTIIVIWGDHGWSLGQHEMWGKHSTFKVALNAPLIIKTPEVLAGYHNESFVEFIDIFPTICELAGVQMPNGIEGKSFATAIYNQEYKHKHQIFARWQDAEVIITKDHSLTAWFDENDNISNVMLFNLEKDPNEMTNLADDPEYQEIRNEFINKLRQHKEERKY